MGQQNQINLHTTIQQDNLVEPNLGGFFFQRSQCHCVSHLMGTSPEPPPRSPSPTHDRVLPIESTPPVQAPAKNGPIAPMTPSCGGADALKSVVDNKTRNSFAELALSGTASNKNDNNDVKEQRPPLPPRPSLLRSNEPPKSPLSTNKRPALQSKPTTAISSVDIQTVSFPDGSRGTFSTPGIDEVISGPIGGYSSPRKVSRSGSDIEDNASLLSYAPTLRANGDLESLLDDGLNAQSPAWKLLNSHAEAVGPFETIAYDDTSLMNFAHEFDEMEAVDRKGGNEGSFKMI